LNPYESSYETLEFCYNLQRVRIISLFDDAQYKAMSSFPVL